MEQDRRADRVALTVALGIASVGVLVGAGISIATVDLEHWINVAAVGGAAALVSGGIARAALSVWRGQPIMRSPEVEFRERGFVNPTWSSQKRPNFIVILALLAFGVWLVPTAVLLLAGAIQVAVDAPWFALPGLGWSALPGFLLIPFIIAIIALPVFLNSGVILHSLARVVVNWRIARWMASERGETVGDPNTEDAISAPRRAAMDGGTQSGGAAARDAAGAHAPPIRIILLPEKKKRRKTRVSATSNVVGRHPMRLLYLWNFDVGHPRNDIRSWQQYGPVYWLWSPAHVPYRAYLALMMKADVRTAFGTTSDDVTRWLAADPTPSGPHLFRRYGLYPERSRAFVDGMWREAVRGACQYADAVIVDARAFTETRAGLTWEIRHAVTTLEPARYLILADQTTDLKTLESVIGSCYPRGTGASSGDPVRIVYEPAALPVERLFDDGSPVAFDYRADRLHELLQGPE